MKEKTFIYQQLSKAADLLNALYSNPFVLTPEQITNAKDITRDCLRKLSDDLELLEEAQNSGKKWTDEDIKIISDFLSPLPDIESGDYSEYWWREDMLMAKLKRSKKSIVNKVRSLPDFSRKLYA